MKDSILFTDLYQLSMAYGYFKSGKHEEEANFSMFFRKNPFHGGYALSCGLERFLTYLESFSFEEEEIHYLSTLQGSDGKRLFSSDFLDYLRTLRFTSAVDAIPEGNVAFPFEPLVRVRGPLIECQLIETFLLNVINFETLIATKASRVVFAAKGDPVLEFGLRRAQGTDGGLSASRAAFVGGCSATSNVLAGYKFGIPIKGTHAHSWVMSFDSEKEAFEKYAEHMPNNCVFLVDTYDTVQGVKNAVEVAKTLKESGHRFLGIRLDSGDLAYLSKKAREIMDKAGFSDASIYASNDLDEYLIQDIKLQDAAINVWGVGTKLATAYEQPALGGVYKITARKTAGNWVQTLKVSEQKEKTNIPGVLQVRRYKDSDDLYCGDMIYDELLGNVNNDVIIDPNNTTRRKKLEYTTYKDLLVPVYKNGSRLIQKEPLSLIQERAKTELDSFHKGIRRFTNPHEYPVGLESSLFRNREKLILQARGF